MLAVSAQHPDDARIALRQRIEEIVAGLGDILPGQAPLGNFVHQNPLHGLRHLPFERALEEAREQKGSSGYLPEDEFRRLHASGRIDDEDLETALELADETAKDLILLEAGKRNVSLLDVQRIMMVFGVESASPLRLRWESAEFRVLERVQTDVPPNARRQLMESIKFHQVSEALATPREETFIPELWNACLAKFGLTYSELDPAEPSDAPAECGERLLAGAIDDAGQVASDDGILNRAIREDAERELDAFFGGLGGSCTLGDLLQRLTGEDVDSPVRALLIRYGASFLDEGLAAWHSPSRRRGFYAVWRECLAHDCLLELSELGSHRADLALLPNQATDAVIGELQHLALPEQLWASYLARTALDLPGWYGIVNWRATHPGYPASEQAEVRLMDFLAVRLVADRFWHDPLCRNTWGIPATLPALQTYLREHPAEFAVRTTLFAGDLPECLAIAAQSLVERSQKNQPAVGCWQQLAGMIHSWRRARSAPGRLKHTVHGSAWRLFRLMQHLGLTAPDVASLTVAQAERVLQILDAFDPKRRAFLWLQAYERHYREQIFAALTANRTTEHARQPATRSDAQIVFCMDDREEGIRRHLEELEPTIETFGAAGFFNVAMNWRGLDDDAATPRCPVTAKPAHEVREEPGTSQPGQQRRHRRRLAFRKWFRNLLFLELRRNLLSSQFLILLLAPFYLMGLVGKVFFGPARNQWIKAAVAAWRPSAATTLAIDAEDDGTPATSANPRSGFTDAEQADRVAALLRAIGLGEGFAPLVVLMGHGSLSQNNPHLAAYDCGACGGRHGGPNACVVAAMANRPVIRRLLAARQMEIPADTWFIGAEHDTCNDQIRWYDAAEVPPLLRPGFHKLKQQLQRAAELSAHERCRRFASAPRQPTPSAALRHVLQRAADFSQTRPELGNACNAVAFVARRALSRGAFFDRRAFLVSYDPVADPLGTVLEDVLLAVVPVAAGINLEYYFSTVDNERFGCGTTVSHNITGGFAVMDGTASDLRTGLPRQMIETHEAMRLLIVVEQTPEILAEILQRHPTLRELIGNAWVRLATIDPDDGPIRLFDPELGFSSWQDATHTVPADTCSPGWYSGHREALPPALIRQPAKQALDARHD